MYPSVFNLTFESDITTKPPGTALGYEAIVVQQPGTVAKKAVNTFFGAEFDPHAPLAYEESRIVTLVQ